MEPRATKVVSSFRDGSTREQALRAALPRLEAEAHDFMRPGVVVAFADGGGVRASDGAGATPKPRVVRVGRHPSCELRLAEKEASLRQLCVLRRRRR